MTDIRDLPGIIERAIPMPPHATISQGAAVERLRAVTEAQVREVIEAERAEALREAARGCDREFVATTIANLGQGRDIGDASPYVDLLDEAIHRLLQHGHDVHPAEGTAALITIGDAITILEHFASEIGKRRP